MGGRRSGRTGSVRRMSCSTSRWLWRCTPMMTMSRSWPSSRRSRPPCAAGTVPGGTRPRLESPRPASGWRRAGLLLGGRGRRPFRSGQRPWRQWWAVRSRSRIRSSGSSPTPTCPASRSTTCAAKSSSGGRCPTAICTHTDTGTASRASSGSAARPCRASRRQCEPEQTCSARSGRWGPPVRRSVPRRNEPFPTPPQVPRSICSGSAVPRTWNAAPAANCCAAC